MGVVERDRRGRKDKPGSFAATAAAGSAGKPSLRRRDPRGGAVRKEDDGGDR